MFQASLVACGYSQIPGIDFTKNYSPMMNDITWCNLLVEMIVWKLDAIIVDVHQRPEYCKKFLKYFNRIL